MTNSGPGWRSAANARYRAAALWPGNGNDKPMAASSAQPCHDLSVPRNTTITGDPGPPGVRSVSAENWISGRALHRSTAWAQVRGAKRGDDAAATSMRRSRRGCREWR